MTAAPVFVDRPPSGTPAARNSSPISASSTAQSVLPVSGEGASEELPEMPPACVSKRNAVRASNASGRLTTTSACQGPAMPIGTSSIR